MSRRWLVLHLRSRRVPGAVAATGAITLLSWWAGSWLMSRPFLSADQARIPVSALGALAVAGVLAAKLGSADEWLDRSTPSPWRTIRAIHLLVAAALGAAMLALAGLRQPALFGAPTMARGVVGLLALGAIAASVVGARAAWMVVLGYASTVYLAAPRTAGGPAAVWAWPMQPATIGVSFVTAAVLLGVALVVHAAFGARPTTDAD